MRILAIESSERLAKVGLFENSKRVAESVPPESIGDPVSNQSGPLISDRPGQSSSRQLIPEIQTLLEQANWKIQDVELICLTIGPGSFTGLRIGLVTAKSLCYAAGARIIGIPALQAIARQTQERMQLTAGRTINVVVNAHRQQLFGSKFTAGTTELVVGDGAVSIENRADWFDQLNPQDVVTGSGLKQLDSPLLETLTERVAPVDCWSPDTSMIARIGWELAELGRYDDLWTIQPRYYRPSYAEI